MSKPTLLLVHGSWHCPEHFELLLPILERHGYSCVAVGLPSTQSPELPPRTLADDTAAVREAALTELDKGKDILLVAHSYGGCPTNNALAGLDTKSRNAEGAKTAVTAIVFLCAIPLLVGGSFIGALGGKPHPVHDLSSSREFASVGPPGPGHYFYNDLPPDGVKRYSDMLRPQAWIAYEQATTHAAFLDIPSWYLYCERDQVLPPPAQRGIVQAAEAAGAKITTASFDSSHSPFLSMPEKTADFIVQAAEDSVKAQ